MSFVRGVGLRIQTARWAGKGKIVLAVHGLTANCRCWDLLAEVLTPWNQLIALDLRGRGRSDRPDSGYSISHHVRDIVSVLDDLHLDRPVVVMGHSLGAVIGLALAADHPDRVERLILLDGGGEFTEAQRAKVFQGIKPFLDRLGKVFPSFEAYLAPLKATVSLGPWNDYLETYFSHEIEETEKGLRSRVRPEIIREELLNIKEAGPSRYYSGITAPVLLLRATRGMLTDDDLVLPEEAAARLSREIPRLRRMDLEQANHYTILFQPHRIRDQALLQFLED